MDNFEFNKVFAAVLCAGIVAMLGGFAAKKLIHPHELKKDAVFVEGEVAAAGAGPAKVQMPDPILHLIAAADVAKGEKLSKACAACHSFNKGGPHKVGPNLWHKVLQPVASEAGFAYSNALREHGGAWSYKQLNGFLWKPKKHVVGTKMNYIGMKKPEDRAAIIAWMRTKAPKQAPLPNASEIAAEKAKLTSPEAE